MKSNNKILKLIILLLVMINFHVIFTQSVSDSYPENNKAWILLNSSDTRNLTVQYVLVSNMSGAYVDPQSIDSKITRATEFIQSIYPLRDNGVINNWNTQNPSKLDLRSINAFLGSGYLRRIELFKQLEKMRLTTTPRADRIIAVVPLMTSKNSLAKDSEAYSHGVGTGASSIIDESIFYNDFFTTVSHEISHGYGICDEYSSSTWELQNLLLYPDECPNGDIDDDGGLDPSCYEYDAGSGNKANACRALTYRELNPFDDSINRFEEEDSFQVFRSFMGVGLSESRYWISKEAYDFLLNEFKYTGTSSSENNLLVSASVYKNGTYNVDPFYKIDNSVLFYENSTGNFSIILRDSSNNELFKANFQPSFLITGEDGDTEETNLSYFVFMIPYYDNISSIDLFFLSSSQKKINRSSNTPTINLVAPVGGEIYLNSFNVSWNASDSDNDSLTYIVQISDDNNGWNWTTMVVDLNVTHLELNNADFSYGTNYKIKVYTSDGINTNSNQSSSFTIIPPPRVSVNSISELFSNGSNKIYEAEIENTGGYNLTKLSWRFNTGTYNITNQYNTSLIPNQKMKLILQANYSSGFDGLVNVSMYAYDLNKSVNDSLTEYFIVNNPVYVESISKLHNSSLNAIINFVIKNSWIEPLSNINWSMSLGDSNTTSSTIPITIGAQNKAHVFIEHNYSSHGTYNISVNVTYAGSTDNKNLTITI